MYEVAVGRKVVYCHGSIDEDRAGLGVGRINRDLWVIASKRLAPSGISYLSAITTSTQRTPVPRQPP